MAGRKYRLFDTVNNNWIEFDTQEEMNDLYNSEENTQIHTPYSGYRQANSTNRRYVPMAPQATPGYVSPEDSESVHNPFGKGTDVRTPYYLSMLPEYQVGTPERKAFLESPIDDVEDNSSWISNYYTYMKEGFSGLSEEAQNKYLSQYKDLDNKRITINALYDPTAPEMFRGRVLTNIAGNNALYRYCEENNVPENSSLWNLARLGNVKLAELAKTNSDISEVVEGITDYYMQKYYGAIANMYKNEAHGIAEDIKNNPFSQYNQDTKNLQDDIKEGKVGKIEAAIRGLGNSLFNNDLVKFEDTVTFTNTEYHNPQRERAEGILDIVADRNATKASKRLFDLANGSQEDKQKYSDIVDEILTGVHKNEDGTVEKGASFDDIAKGLYSYYGKDGHIGGHIAGEDDITDEDKVKLYYEYQSEAVALGPEMAQKNLTRKLTAIDKDLQSWYEYLGVDAYKLMTTTIGTAAQIFAGAYEFNPVGIVKDIVESTEESINDDTNFIYNLWGDFKERFHSALNNDVIQWANGLQDTGYWIPSHQKSAEADGTELFHIVKDYGHEEEFSFHDAIPVVGMSYAMGAGAKSMNYVANGLRSASKMSKAIPIVTSMNAALTESTAARTLYTGMSNMARTAKGTGVILDYAAKGIDLAYPMYSTAMIDFGYGYDRYSQDNLEALQYTGNGNFENASDDFKKRVTSDAAIKRTLLALGASEEEISNATPKDFEYFRTNRPEIMDMAYELESKAYMQEMEELALNDAILTTGLTILPDMGISATWRKAMFSPSSNATFNNLKTKVRSKFGSKPVTTPDIESITYNNGQFTVKPKQYTLVDLIKPKWDNMKGGFASNYIQDLGVGAGTGYHESTVRQYLEQRYSDDVPDSISYCLEDIIGSSALRFGDAVGAYGSFRDGAYGGLAGVLAIYPTKRKSVKNAKGFLGKTDAILSNAGIPLYDMTFGAFGENGIINQENVARAKAATTVQDWLDNNGEAFLSSIGGIMELSKKERAAVLANDWESIDDSRRGQIASAAMMMALIGDKSPLVATQVKAMRERAERGKITAEDLKRLDETIQQVKTLAESGDTQAIESLFDKLNTKDRSIIRDLIEIDKYNKGSETVDTRSGVRKLNDLYNASQKFINAFDNMYKYLSEANVRFPEADNVVKQEYARMMVYKDIIKDDVKIVDDILKRTSVNPESTVASTVPVSSAAVAVATSKGKLSNVSIALEQAKRDLEQAKQSVVDIEDTLESHKYDPIEGMEDMDSILRMALTSAKEKVLRLKAKIGGLSQFIKEANESDITDDTKVLISANDIDSLSDIDKLSLLTSKDLTSEQQVEVDKYLNAAKKSVDENNYDYLNLLSTSVNGKQRVALLESNEDLTPEAVRRLNQRVNELKQKQAERYYENRMKRLVEDLKEIDNYEEFAKQWEAVVKRINEEEDNTTKLKSLQNSLKDFKFFKEYQANQKAADKAIADVRKYISEGVMTKDEFKELVNAIHFAAERKGISDNILPNLISQSDNFYSELKEYLEDVLGKETIGTAEDLKNRLIYYNNGITSTIEKNKAEEEARKKDKENEEVKKAAAKATHSNVSGVINALTTYLKENNLEVIKTLGGTLVGNINQETMFTKQVLTKFKDILQTAINADVETIEEFSKILNEELHKVEPQPSMPDQISVIEYAGLGALICNLITDISAKTGKLVPYIPVPSTGGGESGVTSGTPRVSIIKNLDKGTPYTFADLSKHPDSFLYQLLQDHKVSDFLTHTKFTRDTKLVFLTSSEWISNTQESMGDNYVEGRDMPIIGAIEVANATETTFTIDGKNYQPIGVMRNSEVESNTSIVRSNAISNTKSKEGVYLITDSNGEVLSTHVENNPKAEINNDAEPVKFELKGKTVTANKVQVTEDAKGKKQIRINMTPASNDAVDTSKANWAFAEIAEMAETTNEEGQTLVEVENPVEFNSRTQGFASVLETVIKNLAASGTSLKAYITELSGTGKDTNNLNMKISKAKEESNVGLSQHISLANGYHWALMLNSKEGTINLTIIDEDTKNPMVVEGNRLFFPIASQQSLKDGAVESLTPVGDIIKTLAQLRTKDGSESLTKWQVNYGNFDLDKVGENGKVVDTSFKVPYIQQVAADGILYTLPALIKHEVLISPVQDVLSKQKVEAANAQREVEAAAAETAKHIDPATGTTIEAELNKAKTDELSLIKSGNLKGLAITQKVTKFLSELLSIKNHAESTRTNRRDTLKPNQSQTSSSTTGTTSIIRDGVKSKNTPSDICNFVIGNCVDSAIRDFFNPTLETSKKSFREKYKDVLNEITCDRLYEAIDALNNSFAARGWRIISNGVYTVDEAIDGGKVVGEVDLIALDALGNIHIIDIKTYSDTFQNHNYSKQLSLYRADLMRNTETSISPNDLHVFALKIDKNSAYYNVATDQASGISTITKKGKWASKSQIESGARFELFDSTSMGVQINYIGDSEVQKLINKRRSGVEDYISSEQAETKIETTETAEEEIEEIDEADDYIETDASYYESTMSTEDRRNTECK